MNKQNNPSVPTGPFHTLFHLRDDAAKGRTMELLDLILTPFYTSLISGTFYTSYLILYGMSVAEMGILNFIPFLGNFFNLFSPLVLSRFRKRKGVLLAAKAFYYSVIVVGVNLIPVLVAGDRARLVWLAAVLFLANSGYALFSPGFTNWFYRFYPEDMERRSWHVMYQQIFNVLSSGIASLLCGSLADLISGTDMEAAFIIGIRYFAILLVLLDVLLLSGMREPPLAETSGLSLGKQLLLPLRYPYFVRCLVLIFVWNYFAYLPSGVWGNHLRVHLGYSFTTLSIAGVIQSLSMLLLTGLWRRILPRFSWIKTFGIAVLMFVPFYFAEFFLGPEHSMLYLLLCILKNIPYVGITLAYSNLLYLNLPKENAMVHLSVFSFANNLFIMLGMLTGTLLTSITGDVPAVLFSCNFYSVQLVQLIASAGMLVLGLILVRHWKKYYPSAVPAQSAVNNK